MGEESRTIIVGYVRHTHGLKGELFVRLQEPSEGWLEKMDKLYLQDKAGQPHEFRIKACRPHKDGLIVLPEGMTAIEQVEGFVGSKVLIPAAWLIAEQGEKPFLYELLHFQVVDETGALRGEIQRFQNTGHQDLAEVSKEGRRFLVPFVAALITGIDYEKKQVHMNLPSGIEDLDKA